MFAQIQMLMIQQRKNPFQRQLTYWVVITPELNDQ